MTSTDDYLDRAVARALRGPARDRNPRVGCVLVAPDGQVVAEGHHAGAGTAHAEAAALAAAGGRARGATAYVTLEPCHHVGRTGPCTRALLEAGVARVVYAVPEPTQRATGGADWLRGQGLPVEHVPHAGAYALVADWARAAALGRPHVTWKIAGSLDGRVAAADGTSRWITSPEARADAHTLRAQVDAVVVGTGTALADDPALTARDTEGQELADQPLRVVVGRRDLPPGSRLTQAPSPALHLRTHDPHEVLRALAQHDARTVLLEGGPTLGGAFWAAGCVDELLVYVAPVLLGAGPTGVPDLGITTIGDAARLRLVDLARVGPDVRLRLVPTAPAVDPAPDPAREHTLVPTPSPQED
ncbi:bifunctional diaminohydroxyphosphoribosylaminopyrimidine deaminase/5-amino-6-(5-phosphoribosylamino)uracil reductase RibD [Ornithinimicrobium pekingense]|uniref:Riboflavin biosynthesis protein RibD n=1 Tax=Ornithinimicrobium pekingense TaxID=384677 RepID=A0ABQ2FDH3_9MICO|nr:bifunctional diaminohydroxyphosphoribosylaminopyrimidine deaminase/5-amino-6-(5-phosphoribosylamino)uracil reductase RibD [Ornithinimicrobium pekingense]GGK82904.1 bifunctional diaminohydroxyphosphoribosylaminopyrimidine deaminase/5-amino-6-(5-phosphoribosylamino)uracil reductase [Ornithinimicrobium pekingense]